MAASTGIISIPLTRGMVATIDSDDLKRVAMLKWYAVKPKRSKTFYAYACLPDRSGKRVMLHRFITEAPRDVQIDHRDQNGLNCQRNNLRLATASQNAANRNIQNPKSGYRGVFKKLDCSRWEAYIRVEGKRKYLGLFFSAEDAARAYDAAAKAAFGEFASLNFGGNHGS